MALAAAACGGTAPGSSASPPASPSSLPKTTLTVCDLDGLAAKCGNVWVPQDWAHPAGPTMPLQRFSSHVRAAVLDSGALLNVPLWQQASVHEQQAFDQVAARCAATPGCARSYHPAADLAAVLARLTAHPAQVAVTGPSGQRQTVTITATDFQNIVMDYLAEVQTAVLLPADLHAFALGQWSQVLARLGWIAADFSSSGLTASQYLTIECGDEWAAMNPATISQQGPSAFVPAEIANAQQLNALCAAWPHDPGVSGTVRSTVPVVFLNGTDDPVDPPGTVAAATATMPNALLVAVPDSGHWTLSSSPHPACLITDTTAFIQAGLPSSAAAWDACTGTLAHELVPFPAP